MGCYSILWNSYFLYLICQVVAFIVGESVDIVQCLAIPKLCESCLIFMKFYSVYFCADIHFLA